jgi:uncharacterized protein YhaN
MRIQQLDLLSYGHFTNARIVLPANAPDIHFVSGANEAGKSTSMAGIEDLLFGIPPNSPRNFLHEYGAMRVGATLERGGDTLKVRRRKGNKDTLLSEQDVPLPSGESALAPYLAGADRRFCTRMFSLDHDRLRQGGKEILQAQDDVGQMLFSASTGILGLREKLKVMEAEADALWASRRASHRKYYQAEERLKTAETSMRDHIVTAGKWQLLKSAFETSNEAHLAIEQEIEIRSAELRKLSRIRRVCRDVRRRTEAEVAIREFGEITLFSEDASQQLEKASKDDDAAALRIATLKEQVDTLRQKRTALAYDPSLLLRADDIQQLRDRRIQIRAGKADLPKRRAELAGAEAAFIRLAAELEWTGDLDQLIATLPPRTKVAILRTLLNRRGEQIAAVENAKAAVSESDDKLAELAAKIEALGKPIDVSKLAAVLKASREIGDIAGRIASSRSDARTASAAIERGLRSLQPAVPDHVALEAMSVPPLASIEGHRDACRRLEQRVQAYSERKRTADQELARHRRAYERITSLERVTTPDELQLLRSRRDAGWSIICRRYVVGVAVSEDEVSTFSGADKLPQAFEAAVRDADLAADQRFEKSEVAARLAVIARQIGEQSDILESLATEEKELAEEGRMLDAAWMAMWAAIPVAPQAPDVMIQWVRARSDILNSATQLSTAEEQTAKLYNLEFDAKRLVQAELEALGLSSASVAALPLNVVIETAAAVERTHENSARTRRELEDAQRKAAADAARKLAALEKSESDWNHWVAQWAAAISSLRLPATSTPETADTQINAIDDMRETAGRINDLRHERIEKIERDVRAFEHDVATLVQTIAPQLAGADSEDAVLDLEGLLAEAKRIRDLANENESVLRGLQTKVDECNDSCRDAREVIRQLQKVAGVETVDALWIAIRQSDEMRGLRTGFDRLSDALAQDGDGLSIVALSEECAAIDLDGIAAREQTVTEDVQELRGRLTEASENRTNARREFQAIGGDDRVARYAADRQAALAEIKEITEQYVRLRSAILVLRWAIDRYRREKQGPMLNRTGELFAVLTGGSFQTLKLEFDDDDNVALAGIRQDGRRVAVAGMSDGTTDQLYLALRIAAIEDYLDRAEPMPFVADDLFINFDDERAAAGFRVLNELARKTQVLFFTHHEHLLDVARKTLGPSISTVALPAVARHAEPGPVRSEAA